MVTVLVILSLILIYIGLHRKERSLLIIAMGVALIAFGISLIDLARG